LPDDDIIIMAAKKRKKGIIGCEIGQNGLLGSPFIV
jgi:hypothetical protein